MSNMNSSSLIDTLHERLAGDENFELEFKSAKGGLPKSLWPTVSAFANTRGGWVVLGVKDKTFEIEGISNPSAILQEFHDLLRNKQKISIPMCGADDTEVTTLDNKQIVVLRIPAVPRKSRPIYINGNPYEGTYVRRHSGDYHCTKQEVDRMMREASDVAADSTILEGFTSNDLDKDTLQRYRRRYQTSNPNSPLNSYNDTKFLQHIGGYRRDRGSGKEGITVAGLLLTGRPEALREWRTRHLIDYRLMPEDNDLNRRWDDRVAWEGNLFGAFETIFPRLISNQAVPFRLENGARIDQSPVQVAMREALVNLLVHADYAETQTSLVMCSPKGYIFRNPGSSRILETELLTGDRSDPRNPELVRMFRFIGFAEEAGTGMPKILRAWRELGFKLPTINTGTERYEFSLKLHHTHLFSDEDRQWLGTLGDNWSEAEQLALMMAKHDGDVDNLRLRRLTGMHPADVTKLLGSLRDRHLLHMRGTGRNATYALGGKASESIGPLFDPYTGTGSSSSLKDTSKGSPKDSPKVKRHEAKDVWPELESISKEARENRRLDTETRNAIIIKLCVIAALSLREIALLIGRSEVHTRDIVQGLVGDGQLTYLYANQPSHPRQKYVANI